MNFWDEYTLSQLRFNIVKRGVSKLKIRELSSFSIAQVITNLSKANKRLPTKTEKAWQIAGDFSMPIRSIYHNGRVIDIFNLNDIRMHGVIWIFRYDLEGHYTEQTLFFKANELTWYQVETAMFNVIRSKSLLPQKSFDISKFLS